MREVPGMWGCGSPEEGPDPGVGGALLEERARELGAERSREMCTSCPLAPLVLPRSSHLSGPQLPAWSPSTCSGQTWAQGAHVGLCLLPA